MKEQLSAPPKKTSDLPATRGMLTAVDRSLQSSIRGLGHEMEKRFKQVDARFKEVDARFDRVDAKLEEIKTEVSKVLEFVSRTAIEHEAQRGENRIIYENMHGLYERQERIEGRTDDLDHTLKVLARKKS